MSKQALIAIIVLILVGAGVSVTEAGREMIPADRRAAMWADAGVQGGIPNLPVAANVRDFGAVGNGTTDDTAAIKAALQAAVDAGGGAVYFPAGTYLLREQLRISYDNIVLRGDGPGQTSLRLDIIADSDALSFRRYQGYGDFSPVVSGFTAGSTNLTVADGSQFEVGEYAEITQDNAQFMFTKPEFDKVWAEEAVGQVFQITAINGNTLTINDPLLLNYSTALNVRARALRPVIGSGIEDMHIIRIDKDNAVITDFRACIDCWVRNIESEFAFRIHVRLERCYRCEVRDSYFHHAHDYGSGGHGYGVSLNIHTTKSLVENNIFHTLRHSMILATGAGGNVWAYNYSADSIDYLADISLHGHYPNFNLFEGNLVQDIQSADNWGPSGPGNTFFRNAVEIDHLNNYGIRILDHSTDHNVVGNVLAGEIYIEDNVTGTLIHGNKVQGQVSWSPNISDRNLPDSYYLDSKPAFFGDMPWPPIGPDIDGYDIPARQRYLQIINGEDPTPPPTQEPAPEVSLSQPSGTVTESYGNPTYTWAHDSEISAYQMYIAPQGRLNSPVFFDTIPAATYCNGGTCSVDVTEVNGSGWLVNGTYEVYFGVNNRWNMTPSVFTIDAPVPGKVTPQGVTGTQTLSWSLEGAATHISWFRVYVAPTSTLANVAMDTWVNRRDVCDGTSCSFTVPGNLANNHYSAYVIGWGPGGMSAGEPNGWAGPISFNIGAARPNVPAEVTVTVQDGTPTVRWDDDNAATDFQVYIGVAGTQNQINLVAVERAEACANGTCSYTTPNPLSPNTYHVFIQARGEGGIGVSVENPNGWSAEARFTIEAS